MEVIATRPVLDFAPPQAAGALVVAKSAASTTERLELALARIAKFEASFEVAQQKRFLAGVNPVTRFVIQRPYFAGLSFVGPPLVALGAWLSSAAPPLVGLTPMLGFIGATCFGMAREGLMHDGSKKGAPLTTRDLSETANFLAEMPAAERALLTDLVSVAIDIRVDRGEISSAATEHLTERLAIEKPDAADLRAGRAAQYVRQLEDSWEPCWRNGFSELFEGCPPEEATELAAAIQSHFFKNEKCRLGLEPADANRFYRALRAKQNAA